VRCAARNPTRKKRGNTCLEELVEHQKGSGRHENKKEGQRTKGCKKKLNSITFRCYTSVSLISAAKVKSRNIASRVRNTVALPQKRRNRTQSSGKSQWDEERKALETTRAPYTRGGRVGERRGSSEIIVDWFSRVKRKSERRMCGRRRGRSDWTEYYGMRFEKRGLSVELKEDL